MDAFSNRPALIDCLNDGAAMEHVRQSRERCALEVWEEGRKVGRIEPEWYEPTPTIRYH